MIATTTADLTALPVASFLILSAEVTSVLNQIGFVPGLMQQRIRSNATTYPYRCDNAYGAMLQSTRTDATTHTEQCYKVPVQMQQRIPSNATRYPYRCNNAYGAMLQRTRTDATTHTE
ncbi:MAG: hypothetical protein RH948_01710 [Cyclobacteriaceae bacterium]